MNRLALSNYGECDICADATDYVDANTNLDFCWRHALAVRSSLGAGLSLSCRFEVTVPYRTNQTLVLAR